MVTCECVVRGAVGCTSIETCITVSHSLMAVYSIIHIQASIDYREPGTTIAETLRTGPEAERGNFS